MKQIKILLLLISVFFAGSCVKERIIEVPVEKEVIKTDTIYVNKVKTDTIYVDKVKTDTVKITEHDTIVQTVVQIDTVIVKEILYDTVYTTRYDTVHIFPQVLPQDAKDFMRDNPITVRDAAADGVTFPNSAINSPDRIVVILYWTTADFMPADKSNKVISVAYLQAVEEPQNSSSKIVMRPIYYSVWEQYGYNFVSRSLSPSAEGFSYNTITTELPVEMSKHSYAMGAFIYDF